MSTSDENKISGAEVVLGRMKEAGVDVLFANGGTDFPSIIEAYANSAESGIEMPEPVVVPHEGVAMGMAHGYYLMTGKMAGVIVHVNVGLANSVMGLINAASENVPILMCSGRTPYTETGRFGSRSSPIHWGQEMRDQSGMVREVVKWDYEMRYGDQGASLVDRAVNIAMSEPRGPVYLSLPREALAENVDKPKDKPVIAPNSYGPPPADMLAKAAKAIADGKNVVIISQSPDMQNGFEPLSGFAERYAIPVVEFWALRQSLPSDHSMHAGRDPNPWVKDADVIIVANTMVPWVADHVTPRADCTIIAVGPEPFYRSLPMRGFRIDLSLAGGYSETFKALDEALKTHSIDEAVKADRRSKVQAAREARELEINKRTALGAQAPMSAAYVSRCLNEVAGKDAVYFNELGIDPGVMNFEEPASHFWTPISGGLGWGLTAALGAQFADRSKQVIATVGDGSYMFANPVACHQIASSLRLPLLTVVFNNGIWNAVRRSTLYMYPDGKAAAANVMPITALDPAPDYAAVARAHGAYAERVEKGEDLPAAIKRALEATKSGQQALLEVIVGV